MRSRNAALFLLVLVETMACGKSQAAPCVSGTWQAVSGTPDEQSIRYQTEHFAFRWRADEVKPSDAIAAGKKLEEIWSVYMTKVGFAEPFCVSAIKHKANVNLDSSFGLTGGPTGERDMGMWIGPPALKDNWGLAHEFAHALQGSTQGLRGDKYAGWLWESHANWMTHQMPEFRNELHCSEMLVNYPHLYYGSTRDRYCNWQFLDYIKDVYGYQAVNAIWSRALKPNEAGFEKDDPFSILARTQGWSIEQLNDVFGMWAAHNAAWDYVDPDGYPSGLASIARYGSYDSHEGDRRLRVTSLDPIDLKARRFHVPEAWAPQRWGYNLVRLIPDKDAKTITIRFRGVTQEKPATTTLPGAPHEPEKVEPPYSDWRWAVVAVDAQGKPRYGQLMRGAKGEQSFALKADDQAVFLTVMATPSQMQKIEWDQPYYSIYRYPWMAEFAGAMPQGFEADADGKHTGMHRHENGGGWVSDSASVATSAYVGPYARVLGGRVMDHVRIEDHATVVNATVSDHAVVGGMSLLDHGVKVSGNAVIKTTFMGIGAFEPGVEVSGTAQVLGDAETRNGVKLSHGTYYGYVDPEVVSDPKQGSKRLGPVPEVTAKPDFSWIP